MSARLAQLGLDRRSLLRGSAYGAAVAMALPFLDCFLNESGTALAAPNGGKGGRPLPVRFGTWFWGLGVTTDPARWVPSKIGRDYDLGPELRYIAPWRDQVSVLSGYDTKLSGEPNLPHQTGLFGIRSGVAPVKYNDSQLPTLDLLISDAIGNGTRFRSLEVTATGNPKDSYSRRGPGQINPSEVNPVGFYARLFGPEFTDPNSASFTPDPKVMLRHSVLSAVAEDRQRVMALVGAADRARLDEYFTSLRQLEQQLVLQLEKPPPVEACAIPGKAPDLPVGYEVGQVIETHKLMSKLLAMALACNQTRIFNMVYSDTGSNLRRPGEPNTHHYWTHEEAIDKELGYQPVSTWFLERSMEAFATFLETLSSIKEGDGTLLDHSLVFAHSDSSFAKSHSIIGIPAMLAGRAGGRVKTGLHIAGNSEPVTRIGLTLMQLMGLPMESWGQGPMQTSRPIGEIVA